MRNWAFQPSIRISHCIHLVGYDHANVLRFVMWQTVYQEGLTNDTKAYQVQPWLFFSLCLGSLITSILWYCTHVNMHQRILRALAGKELLNCTQSTDGIQVSHDKHNVEMILLCTRNLQGESNCNDMLSFIIISVQYSHFNSAAIFSKGHHLAEWRSRENRCIENPRVQPNQSDQLLWPIYFPSGSFWLQSKISGWPLTENLE